MAASNTSHVENLQGRLSYLSGCEHEAEQPVSRKQHCDHERNQKLPEESFGVYWPGLCRAFLLKLQEERFEIFQSLNVHCPVSPRGKQYSKPVECHGIEVCYTSGQRLELWKGPYIEHRGCFRDGSGQSVSLCFFLFSASYLHMQIASNSVLQNSSLQLCLHTACNRT